MAKILTRLPDNHTHSLRFQIKGNSESKYIMSKRKSTNGWECSCRGWIHNRTCYHLDELVPTVEGANTEGVPTDLKTRVIEILKENGFPEKKVSLPLTKLLEAAKNRNINFDDVLEGLKNDGINNEIILDKIIFINTTHMKNNVPRNIDFDSGFFMGCGDQISPNQLLKYEAEGKWLAEPKFDGIWGSCVKVSEHQRYFSRTNQEKALELPNLPIGTIVVGELGYGSQRANERKKALGHEFMDVMDIVMYRGIDIRNLSRKERREKLEELFSSLTNEVKEYFILAPQYFKDFVNEFKKQDEGLVLKLIDDTHPYTVGTKHSKWVKVKRVIHIDCVITGFTESNSKSFKGAAKSIECSVYLNGQLKEITSVGSLLMELRREIAENFEKFRGRVVEIECYKVFTSGALRHPSFVRFREDKRPEDCTWEELMKLK